jgi:predicted aldo/keto reductase-like oxidoreductase
MSNNQPNSISRRGFVGQFGRAAGAAALGAGTGSALGADTDAPASELPRRILGKTGLSVTCMSLGTAPCGIAKDISPRQVADVVNTALDLGINTVDTSEKYGNAEEGVGLALGPRRREIILATKVWADTVKEAEKKLANSLKTLKTDCADILYFHNLGRLNRGDVKRARDSDGVFTWLVNQKKAGRCRFVGISGHNLPDRFVPFLETGEVDVILVAMNFADRHTYNFEERVLPVARKHDVGVIAMKVFGAPDPKTGSWGNPDAKPNVGVENLETAVRYALSLPGVAAVNLGVHSLEQLRENVDLVKRFQPLSPDEQRQVTKLGKQLAAKLGEHFGPVTEEEV